MPTEPCKEKTPQDRARAKVLMELYFQGALDDKILPPERMAIFKSQPFKDWPKEMQDSLEPYGAKMIE